MNIKQTILGTALILASSGAFASNINVGGVVWNPDAGSDFVADGSLFESFAASVGQFVTGYGEVGLVNGTSQNVFCPACELTYTFSYQLLSATPSGPGFDFTFGNGTVDFWVDSTPDFDANTPSLASAADGDNFLHFTNNGLLTGFAFNLFNSALINGFGSGFLDVQSGLAKSNFDTNTLNGGTADAEFTSSFHANTGAKEAGFPVSGSSHLTAQTVPEPASLALLGMGLLGFGASRMRKQA